MTSGEPTGSRVRERSHQPGSNYLGVFAAFFLLGCGSLVALILGSVVPDRRVFNQYRPNSCIVLEKRVASTDERGKVATYYPEIKIRYQVEGRNYEIWAYEAVSTLRKRPAAQAIVDSFQVKGTYPFWYGPDRPEHAVLVRGHSWTHYVFLLVPIPFLLIGGTGLYSWWKNRPKAPREERGRRDRSARMWHRFRDWRARYAVRWMTPTEAMTPATRGLLRSPRKLLSRATGRGQTIP
jgi:hypothetical protein